MALKDLITDLSNFKYTDYGNAGSIESQVSGRHGTVDAPIDNSDFDNGVGFGQDPNSTPQSFTVRGYQITGNKRFVVNYGGDIIGEDGSIYGMGDFNSILTPFDHTQMRDTSRVVYNQYSSVPFDDSLHTSDGDLTTPIGGGVSYYGNLLPITPRGSIYRDDSGNYQVPQEGGNTLPPGSISNIVGYTGDQVTFNIPQHISTGPEQFNIEEFSDVPLIPNAHGSSFTNTPAYTSQIQTDTSLHLMLGGLSTGPVTTQDQTISNTLQTTPIAANAHGSDFQTTPIAAFSSRFANQQGMLMDTLFESGFSRDDMYISEQDEPSIPSFKEFNRTDTSLKRISLDSPNFDSDGNKFFTFADRIPYNIPARDNTIFGFDQPFMLKDIGDKWGPDVDSTLDEGLVRGGVVTSVARGIADGLRLTKFILTPKGILFGAKQAAFQLLNPREETRIWNPLSLGSGNTTALGIPLRIDRHLGGGTYLDAIGGSDGEDSILTGYGNAVTSNPALQGGKIVFQTARRVTLAHLGGLVPGAGGKVSIGALPEISFDLTAGGSGNITSFSPNTFSDTNDIGFNIPDRNIYTRDKKYHINTGPSSIETLAQLNASTPGNSLIKRVTGADIGSIEDSTGSPLLDEVRKNVGTLYEGLDGLYPPTKQVKDEPKPHGAGGLTGLTRRAGGYSITLGNSNAQDSVDGIPAGNLYDEGDETFPYQQKHNKRSIIPIGLTTNGLGFGPKSGLSALAEKGSIFETFEGTGKAFEFDDKPESQLAVVQTDIFRADTYNRNEPYGDSLNQIGGNRSDGTLGVAVYRKKYYHSISGDGPVVSISPNRVVFNQNGYALDTVPSDLKLKETREWSGDTYSQDNPYADKPSIFIGDKTMLVMGGSEITGRTLQIGNPLSDIIQNKISIEKKSAFTHAFANDRVTSGKDSVLPYNEDLFYGNYTPLDGGKYETNPERFQDGQQDSSLIKQLGVKGSVGVDRTTLFGGRPQEEQVFTISDADTNQYSKDKRYLGRIEVDGKNNFKSIFFGDGRLKGDPSVDFKTQYVDTDKFNRGGASPQQGPFEKTAKLQDFPLINDENSGGNYGNEGQALGFLKGGGRKDNHGDNFYGTDDGRLAFGTSRYSQQVGDGSKYQPDGEVVVPSDTKRLNYQHNVAEVQEGDIGENSIEASFPANENLTAGDINRYRTLAYGQLPSGETNKSNKYSERVIESDDNQPVPSQLDSPEVPEFRNGIGLVKISSDRGGEGSFLDKLDLANLTEYGEDYTDDYIKFKFYDTINKKYIIFPATLSGISDSITPEWSSEKYIGRPDQVHVYTGTTRELSFSFKIGIMSKQQLLVCWEKLNYLIGLTYPTWKTISNSSRMEAPFMELTIGDMFNRTPGFINSLSYSIDDTTPWDIDEGTQLPKSIDVEVTFTHIGRHKLASQGKHFDLPWLRDLESKADPEVENSVYRLGTRPAGFGSVFKKDGSAEAVGGVQSDG